MGRGKCIDMKHKMTSSLMTLVFAAATPTNASPTNASTATATGAGAGTTDVGAGS